MKIKTTMSKSGKYLIMYSVENIMLFKNKGKGGCVLIESFSVEKLREMIKGY